MRPLRAFAALLLLSCGVVVLAGNDHLEMFNCKGKKCAVTELTDSNWQAELSQAPHLVMYVCMRHARHDPCAPQAVKP